MGYEMATIGARNISATDEAGSKMGQKEASKKTLETHTNTLTLETSAEARLENH